MKINNSEVAFSIRNEKQSVINTFIWRIYDPETEISFNKTFCAHSGTVEFGFLEKKKIGF